MSNIPDPVQDIIARWPARRDLATDLQVKVTAVHHWHDRCSIPAKHYAGMIDAARRRRIRLSMSELINTKGHNRQNGEAPREKQDGLSDNPQPE